MGRETIFSHAAPSWRKVWAAFLSVAALGLIVWAAAAAWWRPCRQAAGPECPSLLADLGPILVALAIWAAGAAAARAGKEEGLAAFFLVAGGALAAGELSAMGSDGGARLFYLLLAWLSPLALRAHVSLLAQPARPRRKAAVWTLYALAAALSLPALLDSFAGLRQAAWFAAWRMAVRLVLALSLALAALLLLRDHRLGRASLGHRRARLVAFGTLSACAPLFLLSLLPQSMGASYVPYDWTLPWLAISPLAYGYALLERRLGAPGALLRRGALCYLLVVLVVGAYLAAGAALRRLGLAPATDVLTLALLLGLLLFVAPLERGLRRLIDWALHGGEASYVGVLAHLSESLATTLDREALEQLLVQDLAAALGVQGSALFVSDPHGALILLAAHGLQTAAINRPLAISRPLAAWLEAQAGPVPDAALWVARETLPPHADDQALLAIDGVAYWVPLLSGGALQGLLLIGPRPGGDILTAEDVRILATLAGQAGVAAHNVRLMEQVRAARQEAERAHRQALAAAEREREQLARELHDGAIQQLIAISYQLAKPAASEGQRPGQGDAEPGSRAAIRQEALALIGQLRSLTAELRPVGLSEMGLAAALRGYVGRLERTNDGEVPDIALELDEDGPALGEHTAIILFRAAQEALRNALQHAQASHVTVTLRVLDGEAALTVHDDGCGFCVPERLSELAWADHFGLIGIAERVAEARGRLAIRSRPGVGTEVAVWVPLHPKEERDG